jgi:Domain of unknown function DUF11
VASMVRRILIGFLGVILVVVLGAFAGTAPAGVAKQSGVDVAVGLDATGSLLISGARYTVSVTDNGPQALVAATVVVRLDPRVAGNPGTASCPYDTANHTLTCSFGALAAGATATQATSVYFNFPATTVDFDATATLVSSTPADTDAANNSDSARCHYTWQPGIPITTWPPRTYC